MLDLIFIPFDVIISELNNLFLRKGIILLTKYLERLLFFCTRSHYTLFFYEKHNYTRQGLNPIASKNLRYKILKNKKPGITHFKIFLSWIFFWSETHLYETWSQIFRPLRKWRLKFWRPEKLEICKSWFIVILDSVSFWWNN